MFSKLLQRLDTWHTKRVLRQELGKDVVLVEGQDGCIQVARFHYRIKR